jgi:hypothetical protein
VSQFLGAAIAWNSSACLLTWYPSPPVTVGQYFKEAVEKNFARQQAIAAA